MGLRAATFQLAGEQYLVLSHPACDGRRIEGLSKTETSVLLSALDGLTNAEIALARGRSVHTIQNQLAAALRKLGVSSRHEAAALLAGRER